MRTTTLAAALCVVASACGGDGGTSTDHDAAAPDAPVEGDVGDDSAADVAADAPDVSPADAEDVAVDAAPELVEDPDLSVDQDTRDGSSLDVADGSEEVDEGSGEADVPPADVGTDCAAAPEVCVAPYACLDGVCRLPLAGTTWAESEFDLVEPEELVRIFGFIKSFAADVKFVVIDVGAGTTTLSATYGTADILDPDGIPVGVWWQDLAETGVVSFRPVTDPEDPLAGDHWVTDIFQYSLRAHATVELPGLDPISADFGLDAHDVVLDLYLDPTDPATAEASISGAVTREETEFRVLADRDAIPSFAALFCARSTYDPGFDWNLSDLLDCNGATLDADTDGDGSNDAYRIRFVATVTTARLLLPD